MVDETREEQRKMNEETRMLRAEDVAQGALFMFRQPEWCDVISMLLRPHMQLI